MAPDGDSPDEPGSNPPAHNNPAAHNKKRPTPGAPASGPRPEHPNGAAALLVIGVTLLLILIAVFSTFGGR